MLHYTSPLLHSLRLHTLLGILLCLPLVVCGQSDPLAPAALGGEERVLLQEIPSVYSASKYEQKVTEAPASVSIVTADEIKKHGYRTLADILRSIRGFYVTYDRNYSYLGVRGFARPGDYNARVLLLVDGHRLNENVFDGVLIGTEFVLDVDLIERVEIIRGPSSSLYGNNAFFAVINVITKRGRDLQGAEISGEVGSFDTYKGRFSYGKKFQNGLEALLSGSFYTSEGQRLFFKEFDTPATNDGVSEHSDDDQFYSTFGKLSWRNFTLQGAFVSREKGIPTGAFGTVFNDPGSRTTEERAYLDLTYAHNFGTQWGVLARLFYDRYYYHGNYIYDYPPVTLNKEQAWGEWWGGEVQATTRILPRQSLTFGVEYRDNFRQELRSFDQDPFLVYLDENRSSRIWALYAQDEITLLKNLTLNVGVRYDHYETFGGTTNPRAALIYAPFKDTVVKLLYGTAFRAPNFYELYVSSVGFKPNPDLQPETITTYELILEQYLGTHLRGTAAAFSYTIDNLISQRTDPVDNLIVYQNVDGARAYGVELELEGKWASGLAGRVSYTYQETEDKETGGRLTNAPRHLAKLNVLAPLLHDRLFAGLEVQYTSPRKTLAGTETGDVWLTNLTLFSQHLPLRGLSLSAGVYNLFDVHYGDPGAEEHLQTAIPQDGRNFRFKLTYSF